jgi:hypothetical protein
MVSSCGSLSSSSLHADNLDWKESVRGIPKQVREANSGHKLNLILIHSASVIQADQKSMYS